MNCLNDNQAVLAALGIAESCCLHHLDACDACRTKVDSLRPLASRLAEAHAGFDRGHALGRDRLLAALSEQPAAAQRAIADIGPFCRFRTWLGGIPMQRRIAFSGFGLAAAFLLVAMFLSAGRPLSAMEQVAATVSEAKSYTFKIIQSFEGRAAEMKVYWITPGSLRMEDFADGKPTGIEVFPYRQPGIRINPGQRKYQRLPARLGAVSPLLLVSKLGGFHGQADRELGEKQIDGRSAQGFEIAVTKVDSGIPAGMLAIWVDSTTKLPLLIEADLPMAGVSAKLTYTDFQWNVPLDEKLFDPKPPADYADNSPQPPAVEEQSKRIAAGLKLYAELNDGHYPRVKMVYGDVTSQQIRKQLGFEGALTEEQLKSDNYVRYLQAVRGFARVNTILRENSDAAYYGKTVDAKDADAVLLRWKLDDGRYRVIYGDLRAKTVSKEVLQQLEGK